MATEKWVAVKKEWCNLIEQDVELLEKRVYPQDVIPGPTNYRVEARKCSVDVTCNMAGFPCKWAFTNPQLDPFALRAKEQQPA
jgi:hypothetical protein